MRPPFILLTPMLKTLLPLFIVCCSLLAGCGASMPTIKPFKMDIQQGNVVTSKMLLQLKPGMTKSQVRFIMGTPLVVDSFHKDRWDYFYQMRQAGKIVEQRRVILDFEKELLIKVRGDVVPQGTAGAELAESKVAAAPITIEPKPKETSMLDKLKFWKKDEKAIVTPEAKVDTTANANVVAPAVTVPTEAAVAALPAVAAAAVEETKPTMAKPEAASSAAEKSVSEKSWLDKLKFWKKDAPVVAAEKAAAETPAASDAPSVLAVPIELPSTEPVTEQPSAQVVKEQLTKEQAVVAEPLRTEPYKATKTPSITGSDSLKPLKSPSQKLLPAKPDFIKPMPEKPALPSSVFNKPPLVKPPAADSQLSRPLKPLPLIPKKGEQLIFRMDKSLDLSRSEEAKPEAAPISPVPDAMAKPIKAETEPLPTEAAPSFFDKMLEKIGF